MVYDAFPIVPNFEDAPNYGVSNVVEMAGLSAALDVAFFPQAKPDMTFSFNFAFTTAAEVRAMKDFFRDVAVGKLVPFYLPSWRSDLPAGPGTSDSSHAGDTKVSVFCGTYAATHLDSTEPDHYGRQIFIWQPGEDLFTASVVAAEQVTAGHAVLTVSRYLPFDVDPATAIIGFCHLAHFDGDGLTFDHMTAWAATTEAKFRASREYSDELVSLSIARVDRSPFLGFASAVMADEAAVPADSRIAYADTFNAWVNGDGVRLAAGTAYDVDLPDGSGALSGLTPSFVDTEHLSLTWDSDGEHALAWQSGEDEITVGLHPSDPTYHTFTGRDPLLCTNINVDGSLSDGDQTNACYYRKADGSNLYLRLSPGYETEYVAAALPVRPLKLKRVIEDTEGRTLSVEYLDAQFRTVRITSAAYPAS